MITCYRGFRPLVKFRYSAKATIICNFSLPDFFDWNIRYHEANLRFFFSDVSEKWKIVSNFCGPFRMSGLSIFGLFLVKSTHMQELAGIAPVSRSPSRPNAVWSQLFVAIIFPSKCCGTHCSISGAGGGSGGSSYYRRALQAGRQETPRPGVLFVDTILESSWQSLGSLSSGDFGSNPG